MAKKKMIVSTYIDAHIFILLHNNVSHLWHIPLFNTDKLNFCCAIIRQFAKTTICNNEGTFITKTTQFIQIGSSIKLNWEKLLKTIFWMNPSDIYFYELCNPIFCEFENYKYKISVLSLGYGTGVSLSLGRFYG